MRRHRKPMTASEWEFWAGLIAVLIAIALIALLGYTAIALWP